MQVDPKKTLFLIDGSSFLYRAYYGLRPLTTPKGEQVQAVYGFCRMIKKLIDQYRPHYIAVVWDSKGKTERHELYAEYKGTREVPPTDLFAQKDHIIAFAHAIGLRQLHKEGVEADDIMFSIAQEQKKADKTVVLVTSDKDMGQALGANVVIYDTFKEAWIDEQSFEQKMGFPVAKLPFYFALVGDTSDNIPGVRGIGPKGATELVTQFSSLEDLYAHLDAIKKNAMRESLERNKENAFLSRTLFLLQYRKTGLTLDDFAFNINNWQGARQLFTELGFKSFLAAMPAVSAQLSLFDAPASAARKKLEIDTRLVTTEQQLNDLVHALQQAPLIALDMETDGLRPLENEPVGISFAYKEGEAYYIPFGHAHGEQLSKERVTAAIKPILENQGIKKWLHHAKFDALALSRMGIRLEGLDFDSVIAASLLLKQDLSISLKNLSIYFFDEHMLTYDNVVKKNNYKNFAQVPLDLALEYAAADAHQTLKLCKKLQQELDATPTIKRLYEHIELPLVEILITMELEGACIDRTVLETLGKKVNKELEDLFKAIVAFIGDTYQNINLNSPKQIEQLLYYDLQLPPQKKTSKGHGFSTDAAALGALADKHPVPKLILRYRELFKLKSTYIDALPSYINPHTGRIHTTFSQTAVATGRLASSDPNLQNIPADAGGYGIEIRKAFIPPKGHLFVSADYSQIELRVLAHLSKDQHLVDAFLRGIDIHSQTAAKLFDVTPDMVTHNQRQIGKRINFSVLYGLTPYGLSKDLKIPLSDAKKYIDTYFAQYPQVKSWMEQIVEKAKETGYVETTLGRRRYIPAIHESNRNLYEEAKRVAINTVAQGTAAEIMKLGMIALEKAFKKAGLKAALVLQIHDELLIAAPATEAEAVAQLAQKTLATVVEWDIPLEVTVRIGADWKEVTK